MSCPCFNRPEILSPSDGCVPRECVEVACIEKSLCLSCLGFDVRLFHLAKAECFGFELIPLRFLAFDRILRLQRLRQLNVLTQGNMRNKHLRTISSLTACV